MKNSRTVLLLIAALCFVMLGTAMYLQHVMNMAPCPLCVIQRYLFIAIAIGCLIGAASKTPAIGAGIGLLAALGGLGVAGKHLYVLAHPGFSCGIDPVETALNKIFTAQYMPFMFESYGACENAGEPFIGLSIPQWAFVWFAIFAIGLLWTLLRRKK
ncbi:disulfide bond formation protein B [Janthinobacterium sp.]|uniref:disulfide bond formation protein B n=1 Tax=Janthinobacterium sp. TaxID=1871054 RepID=UPI00289E94F0|nr:disulfide bond formation protein B [Janthinobacterium sp.]